MSDFPPEFPVPGHQLPPTDDPHRAPGTAHSAPGGSEHRAPSTAHSVSTPSTVFNTEH
jgi:hypothetical protein